MLLDLKLSELQELIRREFFERDNARGLYATFTWLVEEVGELADALLQGDRERIMEEIADVIAWTLSIANLVDVSVEEAVKRKYGYLFSSGEEELDLSDSSG